MTENKEQMIQTIHGRGPAGDLRLLPFAVAGIVCFALAVLLGTGSWLLFGSKNRAPQPIADLVVAEPSPDAPVAVAPQTEVTPAPAESPAPAPPVPAMPDNVVAVAAGEIVLGGGESKLPIERVAVRDFFIARTEVTNAEYAEFIKATGRRSPAGWRGAEFPAGTGEFPVSNVSFEDAEAFCKWLGEKLGMKVRLPTEAEWERAARGDDGRKFPWGNEWNKNAATSKETGNKISKVRSFEANRSPFGAYDMAGNVWEWTRDKADAREVENDPDIKDALAKGQVLRIVKGGSAIIPAEQISARARFQIPENSKVPTLGFRYIVEVPAAAAAP